MFAAGLHRHNSRVIWLLWLFVMPIAVAQAPTLAEPPVPQELAATVALGATINGVGAADAQPWHIRATYEMFDGDGRPGGTGTYEEWWAGPAKNKRFYKSPGFTQTIYATSSGLLRRDNLAQPRMAELEVRHNLVQPIDEPSLNNYEYKMHEQRQGEILLHCVELARKGSVPHSYCFSGERPILRVAVSVGGGFQTLYNDLVEFQGRFVARDIRMVAGARPFLNIHVEKIETLDTLNDADFLPSSGPAHDDATSSGP